jgi:hypothetical protein
MASLLMDDGVGYGMGFGSVQPPGFVLAPSPRSSSAVSSASAPVVAIVLVVHGDLPLGM